MCVQLSIYLRGGLCECAWWVVYVGVSVAYVWAVCMFVCVCLVLVCVIMCVYIVWMCVNVSVYECVWCVYALE